MSTSESEDAVDPEQLAKNAYEHSYRHPITLDAQGGVHAHSLGRVRAFTGYEDSGPGTYTVPTEVELTNGETISTEHLFEDVARAMVQGTKDKHEGREMRPEVVIQ